MKSTDLSTDALLNDLDTMLDDVKLLFKDYGIDLSNHEDGEELNNNEDLNEIALRFIELNKLVKELL